MERWEREHWEKMKKEFEDLNNEEKEFYIRLAEISKTSEEVVLVSEDILFILTTLDDEDAIKLFLVLKKIKRDRGKVGFNYKKIMEEMPHLKKVDIQRYILIYMTGDLLWLRDEGFLFDDEKREEEGENVRWMRVPI